MDDDPPPRPPGGGVLDGMGMYSLKWPSPWPANHPAYEGALGDECIVLMSTPTPRWLHKVTMLESNVNGDGIGAGYRFMAEFSAPRSSAYHGKTYTVEIRPPDEYPDAPPFVRFATCIDHVLVHPYGDLLDCFYLEANLKWSERKHLGGFLHLLAALRKLLVTLPEHLVLSHDEMQRVFLTNAPHLVGKKEKDTFLFEREYLKSLPATQVDLDELARQKMQILHDFKPRYPDLFVERHFPWEGMKAKILDPRLLRVLNGSNPKKAVKTFVQKECQGVYSFPMFAEEFCDRIFKEMENFESSSLPKVRPNSMNNYGVVLSHIGLETFVDSLLWKVLRLFSEVFFGACDGLWLDHHHSFVVKYKKGEDEHLGPHMDDSEVTLNVCLGSDFQGARLFFCGEVGERDHRALRKTYSHQKGHAVVHAGKHRHGVLNLESGERMSLIVWGRSSQYRRGGFLFDLKRHEHEESPDMMCVSNIHDQDHKKWLSKPALNDVSPDLVSHIDDHLSR